MTHYGPPPVQEAKVVEAHQPPPFWGPEGDVEFQKAKLLATLDDLQTDLKHPARSIYRRRGTDDRLAVMHLLRTDRQLAPAALAAFGHDVQVDGPTVREMLSRASGIHHQPKSFLDKIMNKREATE